MRAYAKRPSVTTDICDRENDTRLDFRPVTLADLPLINRLLQHPVSRTCDYTVGGIFMWIDCFQYQYCVIDDTLFIRGLSESHSDETAFSLPVGRMELDRAVALILDYCRREGIAPAFSAIPEDHIDRLAALAGGRVETLDGWSDYLYSAEDLATLQGKHYSKKRNHVNRFMIDNPHYEFETLTAELVPETEMFLDGLATGDKADPAMAAYERRQCFDVLDALGAYPFEGAVLRDETGTICAFTLGEFIGDTLYVHIEKMNHEVAGAGETINKLFAAEMLRRHRGLKYINREEDMGDPGLRYAKESYRPVAKLAKYNLRP